MGARGRACREPGWARRPRRRWRAGRDGTGSVRRRRRRQWPARWLRRPDQDPGGFGALRNPRARGAGSSLCALRGAGAPGRPDTMNYLVSAVSAASAAGVHSQWPGRGPRARERRPRAAYRLGGDPALPAPGAVPGGKELTEWHFLPDLRVLGTTGRWSLRGGVTGPGSEVLENPPSALAGAPGGQDCGGSQSLRVPGAAGRTGLGGRGPVGEFLDPGKLLAGGPLSPCRPLPAG